MLVRFSSAAHGAACIGLVSFRVWPPPHRERPPREGRNTVTAAATGSGRGRSATNYYLVCRHNNHWQMHVRRTLTLARTIPAGAPALSGTTALQNDSESSGPGAAAGLTPAGDSELGRRVPLRAARSMRMLPLAERLRVGSLSSNCQFQSYPETDNRRIDDSDEIRVMPLADDDGGVEGAKAGPGST